MSKFGGFVRLLFLLFMCVFCGCGSSPDENYNAPYWIGLSNNNIDTSKNISVSQSPQKNSDVPVSKDCSEYLVYGMPDSPGLKICNGGFLVSYNTKNKTAEWVIEHLTAIKIKTALYDRTNNYKEDPILTVSQSASVNDYVNSNYDMGHLAPAADNSWNISAMNSSFYLTNIVPQVPEVNRDIWLSVENKARELSLQYGESYIFTGTIYSNLPIKTIGTNSVAIPDSLYKIIYLPSIKASVSFIVPNDRSALLHDYSYYLVDIKSVEKITGISFVK